VAAFEQWALAESVSVSTFFVERETDSKFTGNHQSVTVLPGIAFAEYEGQELVSVSPHVDDDTVTVRDHLGAIEARRSTTFKEEANAAVRLAVPGGD